MRLGLGKRPASTSATSSDAHLPSWLLLSTAIARLHAAMAKVANGDICGIKALYAKTGDATSFYGWGCYEKGWDAVPKGGDLKTKPDGRSCWRGPPAMVHRSLLMSLKKRPTQLTACPRVLAARKLRSWSSLCGQTMRF